MIDWRMIPDFPYSVSADGRVRNSHGKELQQATHHNGSRWVRLQNHGVKADRSVHSLVLEAFKGPRPTGLVGRHLDGDPSNNDEDNLEWGTMMENMKDRERHGTTARLERQGRAKMTCSGAIEAREEFSRGMRVTAIAKLHGVNSGTISKLVRGLTWRMPTS